MKIDDGNLTEGEGLCNTSIQAGRRKEDELSATGRVVVAGTGNCPRPTTVVVGGIARVWMYRALYRTLAGKIQRRFLVLYLSVGSGSVSRRQ